MNRRKKLKPYKISRGSFEEQQLREDNRMQNQRALLIILPVVMLAVLAVGIFFGYKSYRRSVGEERSVTAADAQPEEATAAGNLFLLRSVSSASPLSADDVPALTQYRGVKVSPDLVESLDQMLSAAEASGYKIILKEGYISYEEQKERYEQAVADYRKSAKATLVKAESHVKRSICREGESEQQTGLLVYLTAEGKEKFQNTPEYAWLLRHCVDYGFVLRYPEKENIGGLVFSPNLFRYVGAENAYYLRAYDMNFDEYIAYLGAE